MKRALLFFLVSTILLLLVGCDGAVWNPNPPASQTQVAFLQSTLPQTGARAGVVIPDGNIQLMVMNADGTEQTPIGDTSNYAAAHISSNNTKLVVTLFDPELGMRILVGSADGATVQDITPATADYPQLAELSPDGSKVYFINAGDHAYEIWSVNVNGSSPQNLNTAHTYCMHEMTVAPNGKIFFTGHTDSPMNLYVMNADGTGVTPVIVSDGTYDIHHPSITTDGAKVVYERESDGNSNIYIANVNGSAQTPLTDTDGDEDPLVVGDKILFVSWRSEIQQIYSMNLDGTVVTRLTNTNASIFGDYWWN